uniref:Kelch like family member 10 n=1 Tax=Neogobius melanostomus TaxID=47308 RepID=A0A8C6UJN3_9GOBI
MVTFHHCYTHSGTFTFAYEIHAETYIISALDRSTARHTTHASKMRRKNIFCDAVLEVGNDKFPVHKVVICSAMFRIGGISSEIMALVLDYIYTESITISENNVQDLVMAADMLNLVDLVQMCFKFMQGQLCPANCIGIWRFSDFVISPETRDLAWRYIMNHFEEVVECEEFLELTVKELISITEADELNVKNESFVFEAIVHWTHDHERRKRKFPQLLTKVRLSQIPLQYIQTKIIPNTLVKKNYDCLTTVVNSIQAADNLADNRLHRNSLVRPRLPGAILLAIGGWSGSDPTNAIEAYDYKADCWVNVTTHQERPRAYHGSVFFKGSVYCVGGFDRTEHFNSMRRLDMGTRTWHEMPPMYHRRCYVSVTVLQDRIYAMGGYNGQIRLNTAEVFDLEANRWSQIASMSEQRSDANCVALNGKMYICGGFNGTECLQTAECYDPETNQWTMIAPMTSRRSGVAVVAYADQIYAVGGFDGNVRLCSVETYNPSNNTWREVASMLTPRSNFGIEVVDDRIFAVGGFNGLTTTFNVESYDHLLNTWTEASRVWDCDCGGICSRLYPIIN